MIYRKFDYARPIMNPCSTPSSNSEFSNFEACIKAVECAAKKAEYNRKAREYNDLIENEYKRLKRIYDNRIQEWTSRTGEFKRFGDIERTLRGEEKITGEGINPRPGWCRDDFGNGWNSIRRNVNWANVGRMVCARTDDEIKRLFAHNNEYQSIKPIAPPLPVKAKLDEVPVTIQCCNNSINLGSNTEASDILQVCEQSIDRTEKDTNSPGKDTDKLKDDLKTLKKNLEPIAENTSYETPENSNENLIAAIGLFSSSSIFFIALIIIISLYY